jgi:hypothetical protein
MRAREASTIQRKDIKTRTSEKHLRSIYAREASTKEGHQDESKPHPTLAIARLSPGN